MAWSGVHTKPLHIRVAQAFVVGARARLLTLAMFALVVQATLPFLTTNCPVYQALQATAAHARGQAEAMPADCPMMATTGSAAEHVITHPHKARAVAFCALCNVLSPFHGYVAAGLLSLPPPGTVLPTAYTSTEVPGAAVPAAAFFFARGPPSEI